jgi:DNA-binding FadR family transcriptional regulator
MSLCAMSIESVYRLAFYAQDENVIIGFSNSSWPHGARLPSETNLVQGFAVSRTSLRPAIQRLVQRGLRPLARKGGLRK